MDLKWSMSAIKAASGRLLRLAWDNSLSSISERRRRLASPVSGSVIINRVIVSLAAASSRFFLLSSRVRSVSSSVSRESVATSSLSVRRMVCAKMT